MPMHARRICAAAVFLAALALAGAPSRAPAPAWPQRAVKFIIPFGPGAGADIGARLFAERLSRRWGQTVVVENRPGADGIVAVPAFVTANDDHTLLFAATGSFTVHPFQIEKLPYEPRDLNPIARVSNTVLVVAVPQALGVGTLAEMVALARRPPAKLNTALVPGITELVFTGFLKGQGLDMAKIPYRDIVQAGTDVAEGRVQVMMASLALVQPHLQSGKVKLLGRRQPRAGRDAAGNPDRRRRRLSGARDGRLGRPAGAARDAGRSARAHRGRYPRGRRRGSGNQGAARGHRPGREPEHRRRIRQGGRRTPRPGRRHRPA